MEHLFDCLKGMPCCKSCARISSGETAAGVDEKGKRGGGVEAAEGVEKGARAGMEGSVARLRSWCSGCEMRWSPAASKVQSMLCWSLFFVCIGALQTQNCLRLVLVPMVVAKCSPFRWNDKVRWDETRWCKMRWETQDISPWASAGFSLCLYIEFRKTFFNW